MYKVQKETLQTVIKYLQSRPYAEVANLIALLAQSEEIKEDQQDKKK